MARTRTRAAPPAGAGRKDRQHIVKVRFSDDELAAVHVRAANRGLRLAAFVRDVAVRGRVSSIPPVANLAAWSSLARTSANLNQLAHAINAGRIVGGADLSPLLADLADDVAGLRLALVGADTVEDAA